MITLRDYQSRCRDAILHEWEESQSTLAVFPTGTGKTLIFASVILAKQPMRAMVVAHREELIWQARDKIKAVTGLEVEIEMAELKTTTDGFLKPVPVTVSTVQTLNSVGSLGKRIYKFKPEDYGVLIIDEAHHATADSYRSVIDYFSRNPNLRVLGVTATPDRTDEEALGQIFKTVADDYEILDAIKDGWLVDIDQQLVTVEGLDYSNIRTTCGDLNGADLSAVMEAEGNLHGIAGAAIPIIGERRAIVFTVSVNQAELLCNIFNRHKPGMAGWICGATAKDERRETLAKFAGGHLQVVVNCGVLTEGFDDPGVEVIIMARPTKSRSLYCQMVGRSTRPLPGIVDGLEEAQLRREAIANSKKPSCLVVDFVGNSGKHKLMTSADILGGKVSDEAIERAIFKARESGEKINMADALEEEENLLQEELLKRKAQEEARRARLVANVQYTKRYVNPFSALDLTPVKERGWDNSKTLSEKQRSLLLKQGVNPDELPYAQARQVIGELFRRWNGGLCTMKQANCLKKFGYDVKNMTMQQASRTIDALAANGWKRPAQEPTPARENVPF